MNVKASHLLSCECGNKFLVDVEPLSSNKPYNYEIAAEGECDKCKKTTKVSLYHKGAGIYKTVK